MRERLFSFRRPTFWLFAMGADAVLTVVVALWFTGWDVPSWHAAVPTVLLLGLWGLDQLRRGRRARGSSGGPVPRRPARSDSTSHPAHGPPTDAEGLVEQLLLQGRYALLLRPQIRSSLNARQGQQAVDRLTTEMAPVAAGEVCVTRFDDVISNRPEGMLQVIEDVYLDRHTVTNRQFREFVRAGAYADRALWRPEIWPYVGNFLDSTAHPGPRYWADGTYPHGEDDLPVVGVSWYEADAFARWVGKRLPTDAEWLKACSTPVRVSEGVLIQRRYPWGNTMDRTKANVWSSRMGKVVSVHKYSAGAALNQVQQMIGNVWEWTLDDFGSSPGVAAPGALILPTPMKSIRGGAFDTYFDSQATCQFQSGENPLSRKHNIGFRCVLSVSELSGAGEEAADDVDQDAEDFAGHAEEVHA